jgi:radical SAM superfamily enzyme YgiQ (UPF0313 family)
MHILLYVPDNHVTRNFLPQLWPFLLREHTPAPHRVTIIDGNATPMSVQELVRYVKSAGVDLVGMGFMTRMAQKAYATASAIRTECRVPVVFGGPHVTEIPGEALGWNGRERCADSVVLGEADDIWPQVICDAERSQLKETYGAKEAGNGHGKPSLETYREIDWENVDLNLFDLMRLVPNSIRRLLQKMKVPYQKAYLIPVESGRGCPYGCDFCTVTGFFGSHLRLRSNESVITELLALKRIAARDHALISVFFIDDNFAIRGERTKSLLREMIRRDACIPWVAQITANLLKDEELLDLIAASGGRFIFMGLESINPESLRSVRKPFNRPEEYSRILHDMAKRNIFAITSFIIGMEDDRPGVAAAISSEIETWPPVLPVFGLLTPYPGTPLYDRLQNQGRLTRPEHWLDFQPFRLAFRPNHLSPAQAENEVNESWRRCYSPLFFESTQRWLTDNRKPFDHQVAFLVARLLFRGIYFSQSTRWSWVRLLASNAPTIWRLVARRLRDKDNLEEAQQKGPPAVKQPVPGTGPSIKAAPEVRAPQAAATQFSSPEGRQIIAGGELARPR